MTRDATENARAAAAPRPSASGAHRARRPPAATRAGALAVLVLVASSALGAAPGAAERSLAARAARFPAVEAAHADFTQEREVSLVDEVLRASGTITLRAPASMRLELTTPEPLTLVAAGDTLTVLDGRGQALAVPPEFAGFAGFARVLTDLMLGGRPPAHFTERWRDADVVTLVPADTSAPFSEIELRFPPDGPLPATIVLRERGGDRTTIRLSRVRLNAEGT